MPSGCRELATLVLLDLVCGCAFFGAGDCETRRDFPMDLIMPLGDPSADLLPFATDFDGVCASGEDTAGFPVPFSPLRCL